MKTIKQASEERANECVHNPNPNDYPDVSSGDIWDYIKDAFTAGVDFAQRWISVEEELPNKFEWVLCRSELHDCYIAPYLGESGFSVDSDSEITHWRQIKIK